jgi:hypothetical protein
MCFECELRTHHSECDLNVNYDTKGIDPTSDVGKTVYGWGKGVTIATKNVLSQSSWATCWTGDLPNSNPPANLASAKWGRSCQDEEFTRIIFIAIYWANLSK